MLNYERLYFNGASVPFYGLDLSHNCMTLMVGEHFDYLFDTEKDENPALTQINANSLLHQMLYRIFGSLVCYNADDNKLRVFFELLPSSDGLSVRGLRIKDKTLQDALDKLNKELLNINNYVANPKEGSTSKKITSMICVMHSVRDLWICEVSFEGEDKKGWFYIQNETYVAWAIMIVFAYRDKAELRIEVDEKTGEILDVFMFSPIEGISM
jgi:hypothetical protein